MAWAERVNGLDAWDLHDYFVHASRQYLINGEDYHFSEKMTGYDPFLSKMSIYNCRTGAPDFTITIGAHDYYFGLSYGWEGSTFHEACRWAVGGWRQDLTEREWYYENSPGYHRQLASAEEIRRDAEKELARLILRLERYQQTGLYALQWPEIAALMASVYSQWDNATDLQSSFGQVAWTTVSGRRGGTIGFELYDSGWAESPMRLEASRTSEGWRLDMFAPYSTVGDCSWYQALLLRGNNYSPEELSQLRCPYPHDTPHCMRPDVVAPWELWDVWSQECMMFVGREAERQKCRPQIGWI